MLLNFFKPQTVNDGDTNGGIITFTPVLDDLANNLFPDVSQSDILLAELTRARKLFVSSADILAYLWFLPERPTTAEDGLLIHKATLTDTWLEAQDYVAWKGSGLLSVTLPSGAVTTIIVESENEGLGFNPFDLIRLSDGTNEDFVRIQSVAWSGFTATLTCVAESYLNNGYAAGAYVSACVEKGKCDVFGLWLKEITPQDARYEYENEMRLRFTQ